MSNFLTGLVIGAWLIAFLMFNFTTPNSVIIKAGCAHYDTTTGEFKIKERE